jgi:hypothetical protein
MGFPGASTVSGFRNRAQIQASSRRIRPSARGERGGFVGRYEKACHLSHVPALVCHSPPRGRLRPPDDPGTVGASRRQHDDDLHARSQPRWEVRPKPDGHPEVIPGKHPTAHLTPDIPASPQPIAITPQPLFFITKRLKASSELTRPDPFINSPHNITISSSKNTAPLQSN